MVPVEHVGGSDLRLIIASMISFPLLMGRVCCKLYSVQYKKWKEYSYILRIDKVSLVDSLI